MPPHGNQSKMDGWNQEPLTQPWNGFELCDECKGNKICPLCNAEGPCSGMLSCRGRGWCMFCGGAGQYCLDPAVYYFTPSVSMVNLDYLRSQKGK